MKIKDKMSKINDVDKTNFISYFWDKKYTTLSLVLASTKLNKIDEIDNNNANNPNSSTPKFIRKYLVNKTSHNPLIMVNIINGSVENAISFWLLRFLNMWLYLVNVPFVKVNIFKPIF